jgi:hypothetical protein
MNPVCRGDDAGCPDPRRCRPAVLEFRDTAAINARQRSWPKSTLGNRSYRPRPPHGSERMTGGQRQMRSSGCGLRYSLSEVRNARLRFGRVEFRRPRNQFRLGHYADRHEVAAVAVKCHQIQLHNARSRKRSSATTSKRQRSTLIRVLANRWTVTRIGQFGFSGEAGGLKGAVNASTADPQVFSYVCYSLSSAKHLDSFVRLCPRGWPAPLVFAVHLRLAIPSC